MTQRQEEIFQKLCTGLEIPKWTHERKRENNSERLERVSIIKKQCKEKTQNQILEEAVLIRKQHGIKVSTSQSTSVPLETFQEIEKCQLDGLDAYMSAQGFLKPTSIQMQAIPVLLERRDVVGIAPTGSGKTLAFLIPILHLLKQKSCFKSTQALIISPTSELSSQSFQVLVELKQALMPDVQIMISLLDKAMRKKLDQIKPTVLFATPFALMKQIQQGRVKLNHLKYLILDEADRLLSMESDSKEISNTMNYVAQIDCILTACRESRRLVRAMFSATFPPQVSDLANNILIDPVYITIGKKNAVVESVKQSLIYTGGEQGKLLALRQIFAKELTPPVIVFVDTKERVSSLMNELRFDGISVASLHSDLPVPQRNRVLKRFEVGEVWVLIATDMMSRGIDFHDVKMVINYDFPKSTMDYIHRIGRTGRAGKFGRSFTFFTDLDKGYIRPIANVIKQSGGEIPSWMTSLQKANWKDKKHYGQIGIDKIVDSNASKG